MSVNAKPPVILLSFTVYVGVMSSMKASVSASTTASFICCTDASPYTFMLCTSKQPIQLDEVYLNVMLLDVTVGPLK